VSIDRFEDGLPGWCGQVAGAAMSIVVSLRSSVAQTGQERIGQTAPARQRGSRRLRVAVSGRGINLETPPNSLIVLPLNH
jgi:hypothetical protein